MLHYKLYTKKDTDSIFLEKQQKAKKKRFYSSKYEVKKLDIKNSPKVFCELYTRRFPMDGMKSPDWKSDKYISEVFVMQSA